MNWFARIQEWIRSRRPVDPALKSFVYLKYQIPKDLGADQDITDCGIGFGPGWFNEVLRERRSQGNRHHEFLVSLPTPVIMRVFEILHKKEYIASTYLNLDQARVLIAIHTRRLEVAQIIIHELCKYESQK